MKWKRENYLPDAVTVARNLVGKVLVRKSPEGITAGRIVEAEAYGETYEGHQDDGAHVFKGKTERTKVIFGEGGHAYIYLIYGRYCCLNMVCGHEGETGSVLIRALEPLEGIDLMKKRRHQEKLKLLTSGPGCLTMALAIDKSFYGHDLTGDTLYVEDRNEGPFEIEVTKRINIDYATFGKDFPWRFTLKGSPFVTKDPFPHK